MIHSNFKTELPENFVTIIFFAPQLHKQNSFKVKIIPQFPKCKRLWEKLYCEHINSEWVNNVVWDVLLWKKIYQMIL